MNNSSSKDYFHEINIAFSNFSQWQSWLASNPWFIDLNYIEACSREISSKGFIDPIYGFVSPEDIKILSNNYREDIIANNQNCRLRAVSLLLIQEILKCGINISLYAPELLSPYSEILSKLVRFTGSEYLETPQDKNNFKSLRHEDVMRLSFEDSSFDSYITNEVIEHIPDIQASLNEAYRVLKTNGRLWGTFPMAYMSEKSLIKAELKNGSILYHSTPEYHGNPLKPAEGSLVYTIPGWDIITQAKAAGFDKVEIILISSRQYAVIGAEIAGILLLSCNKK